MFFITGLCGAVHTSVARYIRSELAKDNQNIKVVCVGDKSRSILQRIYGKNIILACNEIGRLPPTFIDASKLADAILKSDYQFSSGEIVYNRFKSVVSYTTHTLPVFSLASVTVSLIISSVIKIKLFKDILLMFLYSHSRLPQNYQSTTL